MLKRLGIAVVVVGALGLGIVGVSAATSPNPTSSTGSTNATAATPRTAKLSCADAPKALAAITKLESDLSAGAPDLQAIQQDVSNAGLTRVADRLQKLVDAVQSGKATQRLDKLSQRIEAKCGTTAS
jgi:hypothetical protein